MTYRLTAAALSLAHVALLGGLGAATMVTPVQAQARSTNIVCPAGTHRVKAYNGTERCDKNSTVYTTPTSFASTSGTLPKASKADRCPTGWNTNGDGMECITQYQDSPSHSRPKGSKPCNANEVNEWDVWCTSNYQGLTMEVMRGAALRDYNKMYAVNRAIVPTFSGAELDDKLMTPVARKVFGDKWPDQQASSNSGQSGSAAGSTNIASGNTPSSSCATAAQQGAAIGRALGGNQGRALGGLAGAAFGGLGKKKKPGC